MYAFPFALFPLVLDCNFCRNGTPFRSFSHRTVCSPRLVLDRHGRPAHIIDEALIRHNHVGESCWGSKTTIASDSAIQPMIALFRDEASMPTQSTLVPRLQTPRSPRLAVAASTDSRPQPLTPNSPPIPTFPFPVPVCQFFNRRACHPQRALARCTCTVNAFCIVIAIPPPLAPPLPPPPALPAPVRSAWGLQGEPMHAASYCAFYPRFFCLERLISCTI